MRSTKGLLANVGNGGVQSLAAAASLGWKADVMT